MFCCCCCTYRQQLSRYFFISVTPLTFAADAFTGIFMSTCEQTVSSSRPCLSMARVAVRMMVPRVLPCTCSASGREVAMLQFSLFFRNTYLTQTKSRGETMSIFLQDRQMSLVVSSSFSLQSYWSMLPSKDLWSSKLFCISSQNSQVVGNTNEYTNMLVLSSGDCLVYTLRLYSFSGSFDSGSTCKLNRLGNCSSLGLSKLQQGWPRAMQSTQETGALQISAGTMTDLGASGYSRALLDVSMVLVVISTLRS